MLNFGRRTMCANCRCVTMVIGLWGEDFDRLDIRGALEADGQ